MSQPQKQSWFRKILTEYDRLCQDLGINQGGCRGCMPVVKYDPETEKNEKPTKSVEHSDKSS